MLLRRQLEVGENECGVGVAEATAIYKCALGKEFGAAFAGSGSSCYGGLAQKDTLNVKEK